MKCPIVLSIDDHQLLLIASDGKPFLSFLVDSFVSFSGERYDFVLEVKTNSSSILWMRAKGLLDCQARNIQQLAVVRVRGGKGVEGENLLQQQLPFPPVEQERPSRNSRVGPVTFILTFILGLANIYCGVLKITCGLLKYLPAIFLSLGVQRLAACPKHV